MAPQLRTFTLFKELSLETQDSIWKLAIDSVPPRVIEIREGFNIRLPNGDPKWTGEYTSTSPIPSLLHARRSSCQLALKRWRLPLACRIVGGGRSRTEESRVSSADAILSEYCNGGTNLALRLHRNFSKVVEVVFVEEDVNYNWDRHDNGLQQRRLDQKKTVLSFREPKRTIDRGTLNEFVKVYEKSKWHCPDVRHADYERSRPWSETRPAKPAKDVRPDDWDDYFMQMEEEGGGLSDLEDSDDDDEEEYEGG